MKIHIEVHRTLSVKLTVQLDFEAFIIGNKIVTTLTLTDVFHIDKFRCYNS